MHFFSWLAHSQKMAWEAEPQASNEGLILKDVDIPEQGAAAPEHLKTGG